MVFGDVLARLHGVAPDDDRWDERVRGAFGLDDIRDVDVESGYATDQLENIAWSSATSAQQSPETAITAIRALDDLASRWLLAGERDRSSRAADEDERAVVYEDGAVERVLLSLGTLLVATAESRQAQTCAKILRAFAGIAPRLQSEKEKRAFDESLDTALPGVIQHAEIPVLSRALRDLERVLREHGRPADRVAEVRELLTEATRRMLPKPSDEPEAARPR